MRTNIGNKPVWLEPDSNWMVSSLDASLCPSWWTHTHRTLIAVAWGPADSSEFAFNLKKKHWNICLWCQLCIQHCAAATSIFEKYKLQPAACGWLQFPPANDSEEFTHIHIKLHQLNHLLPFLICYAIFDLFKLVKWCETSKNLS